MGSWVQGLGKDFTERYCHLVISTNVYQAGLEKKGSFSVFYLFRHSTIYGGYQTGPSVL